MPVPIEYNSIRRMSTITVPKQDINFDAYDFQLCQPQSDIKGAFESRELEATFCRDFACCGLILQDLHDLLQHYEECHVRLEDDVEEEEEVGSFYEDNSSWSVASGSCSSSSSVSSTAPNSPTLLMMENDKENMTALKKKAAAYLSDLYNSPITNNKSFHQQQQIEECEEEEQEEIEQPTKGKKRSFGQYAANTNALDLLTQSAVKKIALASGDLPTPLLSDQDFLAQAGALLAASTAVNSSNSLLNGGDKPYKCPVGGCDKAYKNPNGLKYHNQHGHCNLTLDDTESIASKPYQCTIGDCGKRYKNLNGLKYHIEHSHMAALNHTLATFGSSIFNGSSLDDSTSLF